MVVAEIPLWLVHSGDGTNTTTSGNNDHTLNPPSDAAGTSLALLQNAGRGKKCAIYSVDINSAGTRIATCGGDGTVRLWSTSSLFSRKRSRFADDGNYESSEASEESSHSDNDADNNNNNRNNTTASNEQEEESPESRVHDLSSLVRRKKGGEIVASTATISNPTPAITTLQKVSSSPTRKKSQQQQHHQRLLCTLSAHTGSSVLAVRFSHNGRFLASAGDDSAVCIYAKDKSGGATGNLTEHHQSHEQWSRIKLCRGHALDVVGLAWAPDDSHLVSCSLDSQTPIIVWKLTDLVANTTGQFSHSNILCNPYKILGVGIHTSTVKGVTFDPAGTYLASSGDDPAVCIWRAHDDWGLERRIDAASGIFRRWKEDNSQSLSSQTLFRRLSWSTDGAFICSTNCVVKNKHVASTISRDGWNVSTAKSAAAGAANLVGHKQPVVVSRQCAKLLMAKSKSESGDSASSGSDGEDEPAYATLLALGDRHGFVTVWSTRKSRPIFKLQCSESRCTVTDLAWGQVRDDAMVLLVSLLDGQCVALRFKIPDEVGSLLPNKDHAKLFKFRYGIDLDDAGDFSGRRLFVGDNSGPKFIENTLQMSLENKVDQGDDDGDADMDESPPSGDNEEPLQKKHDAAASVKNQQRETQSQGGKKRIRPVLMSVQDTEPSPKRPATNLNGSINNKTNEEKTETDPLKKASDLAEKAASISTSVPQRKKDEAPSEAPVHDESSAPAPHNPPQISPATASAVATAPLQYNTSRIQSVDLPVDGDDKKGSKNSVATCTNSMRVPLGSKGATLKCADLSITTEGNSSWKDQIVGTSCSAIAAAKRFLALGTTDGAIQLYSTSPSLGWKCGTAFRSHPLFVLGHPIVTLQFHEPPGTRDGSHEHLELLVVTADGKFAIYQILPELRIRDKGSVMPAMTHMALGIGATPSDSRLPKLSRIQLTESGQLLVLLSFTEASGAGQRNLAGSSTASAYGSIQAFTYNFALELWMRISDGRFVLSDFYSTLPTAKSPSRSGVLSKFDDAVRLGALESPMTPALRRRNNTGNDPSGDMYQQTEEKANYLSTRSHCEDRMACALALGSASEFKYWLSLYVRALSFGGHTDHLRILVDMLMGTSGKGAENGNSTNQAGSCWWLSSSPHVLKLDRKSLIQNTVITEMSKNRSLQRLTNELALELNSL